MNQLEFQKKKEEILVYIEANLKQSRYEHTLRVAHKAVEMAKSYLTEINAKENRSKLDDFACDGEEFIRETELAALCHDVARNISEEELSEAVDRLGLEERYRTNINLAHSKIGARLIKSQFGIEDQDIINAVSYHTTGRRGMSPLEKIIFLADAIEEGRDYPGVERVRSETSYSLDRGCLASLEGTIEFIRAKNVYLDRDTLEAYEDIRTGVRK